MVGLCALKKEDLVGSGEVGSRDRHELSGLLPRPGNHFTQEYEALGLWAVS